MELLQYIKPMTADQLESFAKRCGTSAGQLKQVAYGHRRASAGLAIEVDRHSGAVVTCEVLRPDIDWAYLRSSQQAA